MLATAPMRLDNSPKLLKCMGTALRSGSLGNMLPEYIYLILNNSSIIGEYISLTLASIKIVVCGSTKNQYCLDNSR